MFDARKQKSSTFLKYLVSYILVFTVLMAFFFLILRSQLTEVYEARQTDRVQSQMEAAVNHLTSEINFLKQTDSLITTNSDIKLATYRREKKYWRTTHLVLQQYASSSTLIDRIVYYSVVTGHVFAQQERVILSEGVFIFTDSTKNQTVFDPTPYMSSPTGQLIWLDGGWNKYLLWFPVTRAGAQYIYFYILDTKIILSQLKTLLSNEVLAVALLDGNGNCVTGLGFEAYTGESAGNAPVPGVYPMGDGTALYISNPMQDGFALAAVVSGAVLKEQVSGAFVRSYLSLLGLSLVGILLVYGAMCFTYRPLRKLVKNMGHDPNRKQNYLELISRNHSELISQKTQLEKELVEYKESLARAIEPEVLDYPYEDLGALIVCLREKRFQDAEKLVDSLISRADDFSGYFLSCILLDCLTIITNSMHRANIAFEGYSGIFTEAVHQCRGIQQSQDYEKLQAHLHELLLFYEKESKDQLLHVSPLRQMVEENYCDPDFGIAHIAEAYHVSISRMSGLFKEEMGCSFLDYLWSLRQKKAQTLLRETELTVNEISHMVGYSISTSFNRKFKQETGLTPSQYREKHATEP